MPKKAKDTMRPYQAALIKEIMPALAAHGSVVLQLPTGGGKTHIATEIVKRACRESKTVWFVCHRREIRKQTSEAFNLAGIEHGVVQAGTKIEEHHTVWVCSVDALARRLEQMDPPDIMIWDEAHHIVARTWAKLKDKFGEAHHLGLTATPDRLDGTGLKESFNHLICGPDTRELIDQGYLSTYRLFGPTIPDMRGVKTRMGDYDKGDVEKEMTKPVLVGDVVEHYNRLALGARAIVFAISVKASQAVVERFRVAGIPAQHVDGKTSSAERDAAVEALRQGTIKILSNVEVFTEGFDLPAIDAVILLRPTKSLAMYRQMIGRGLRNHPGKIATVILDHSGLVHEHGLPDDHIEWALDGFSRPPEDKDKDGKPRLRRCPECTALHLWAAECVECGHAYVAEDRTIEEVYGELREHHAKRFWKVPVIVECETLAGFGKRKGFSVTHAHRWVGKGIPRRSDGLLSTVDAEAWFAANIGERHHNNKNVESVHAFSKRVSIDWSAVISSIKRGLPVDNRGQVIIAEAISWVSKNPFRRGPRTSPTVGFARNGDFAKLMGVGASTVSEWAKLGLPRDSRDFVDVEKAKRWVEEYRKISAKKISDTSRETLEKMRGSPAYIEGRSGALKKGWITRRQK